MLTISPVRSAAHATAYFVEHVDDYYIPPLAQYESEWFGALAQDLGLRGEVDRPDFEDLLNGIVTSDASVGQTGVDSARPQRLRHRPGYDVTFSAPKSISVLALVYGDDAVAQAHRAAVRIALAYLQQQTTTRFRCGTSVNHVRTGRFASALFTHQTSRDLDPQLHTHCVIFNVTNCRGENPRSLESREFFRQQKAADAIYQAALGARLRSLGYDVCAEGAHDAPHVEIASVPHEVRDVFSKRRQSIVQALAQHGVTIQNASARQKQVANLETRKAKIEVSPAQLRTVWQSELDAASVEFDVTSSALGTPEPTWAGEPTASVDVAVDTLFEREARVLQKDLVRRACVEAMKRGVHPDKVLHEINERARAGQLLQREWHGQSAWTTPGVVAAERQVLALELAGRDQLAPAEDVASAERAVEECAAASDQEWTAEQRRAAIGILASDNRIVGLQGLAGTAKTSSVLKFLASRFGDRGVQVVGLAPTHSAVRELQNGAGLDRADTVAGFLARTNETPTADRCFIVDEASLLSTAELTGLMSRVGPRDRMILVGDRQQIGSVSAGRSFAQLQDAGMQTFQLTKILRQKQESLREVVDHAARGMASRAVQMLANEECVTEDEDEERRFEVIAGAYLDLNATQRQGCLVIEPSRRGRSLINEVVLNKLLERGGLSDARQLDMRENVDWTAREKCSTSSYSKGVMVSFSRPKASSQLRPLAEYQVADVSLARKEVLLRASNGVETWWSPEGADASHVRVARTVPMKLAKGCRLQVTANHRMHRLVNGDLVTLEDYSEAGDRLLIKTVDQRRIWLDLANPFNRYLRLGYAVTAHAAQGKTVDRVIAHLPSTSSLSSQRTAYVCLSRAREEAKIVTDSVEKLASSLKFNSGEKSQGLTQIESESCVIDLGQRSRLERFIDGLEKELDSSAHEEYRI
ncbi:exonuclease V subunit alpha [Oceanococcus atlanticus]|uniref:Exonuclease V subunit alpha n=1 Tax=Oceanococcus atlanticus TaxID=1317117 RepID=A0A1Y1SHW8_9GAMM|nr:MobF family relaxase [Oceanococcus atlanticus]ORE89265.1 exonuclease V subunit alpha [Oceanococcus atlanticus]